MLFATEELSAIVNTVMANPIFASGDCEMRHIELDLLDVRRKSELLDYKSKIVLHVLPRNRVSAVDGFLKMTIENGHDVFTVRSSAAAAPDAGRWRTAFENIRLIIRTPCSFRTFVSA